MASLVATKFLVITVTLFITQNGFVKVAEATWCVARSDASHQARQAALDYACGFGADCGPIQSSGLCYLPNTVQAHASYAFNSYYQRQANAPGSCDFAGSATIAKTDPSYGSCVYPSSPSAAGGRGGRGGSTTTPSLTAPPPPGSTTLIYNNGGLTPGLTPGLEPVGPTVNNSGLTPGFTPGLEPVGPTTNNSGLTSGLMPGLEPVAPTTNNSKACLELSITTILISLSCFLVLPFM
ncbi:hypothetical protein HYC85_012550 [Camellia sinensis]|uniref:X8 domain-containing protein n=1 Tax=Camellia sinensis TaxID=4442 RepID=A0A7J7HDG4_CAMSI|nr:hypothetical protein HYC85_012550 [Camellia sinensis]